MGVLLDLERRLEYHIIVEMLGDNNVLISTARTNGEATGVIYV